MMNLLTIKSAFKESIPVMMGYLVLGFAFGMLLVSKGFPIYYAFIMSCFISVSYTHLTLPTIA